ncbi:MAG: class I SAM-dependent methyltransferase [Candidatus Accumulibacter sp.]|uniref:class I SAM-dependent methyltransferase n=1 Tax=Accumulibacter sp. TaxID=2053492 RepID=UPI0025859337|nr:class I SAM-dependent methyltransferase [Accumulibacter sp.]MCM8623206.1 class I SAM-dependent methyltransferase [Accumulibacter sp.]
MEWDAIAALRDDQIASGKDHSANFVLAPAILHRLSAGKSLVDVGCGTGWLTARAEAYASRAVGIDPSHESIALARLRHPGQSIKYVSESVESFSAKGRRFECAISNMAASCAPDLPAFLAASRRILKRGALFIFTIPHPCFWPLYWGYASHPRFKYQKTFAVEGEFKIQKEASTFLTTHFHHPLELYVSGLIAAGFSIESIDELAGREFDFPRFLLVTARAT